MQALCAGSNCSSMMAQRVAINNLADSYMAFNTNYHDTGCSASTPQQTPSTRRWMTWYSPAS